MSCALSFTTVGFDPRWRDVLRMDALLSQITVAVRMRDKKPRPLPRCDYISRLTAWLVFLNMVAMRRMRSRCVLVRSSAAEPPDPFGVSIDLSKSVQSPWPGYDDLLLHWTAPNITEIGTVHSVGVPGTL